jgi:hypothetical protein
MLFLMAQPILINCQEKMISCAVVTSIAGGKCCAAKPEKEGKRSKSSDPLDECNPFASCSQCQFTAVTRIIYHTTSVTESARRIIPLDEFWCSEYSGECWHPPESV